MTKVLETYDEKCIGCNSCVDACANLYFKDKDPEKSCIDVIDNGNDDFHLAVCNQCAKCIDVCGTDALAFNKQGVVMLKKKLCVECHVCYDVCPTDSMKLYHGQGVPFKCVSCGVCVKVCPADALAVVKRDN